MIRHRALRAVSFLGLLAALALAGCGDDSRPRADDDATATGSAALEALGDAWCPLLAPRYCDAAARCGCEDVPGFTGGASPPCLERAEQGCRARLMTFASALASGELVAAPELPPSCLVELDAALVDCALPPVDLFTVSCPLVWPRGLSRTLPAPGAPCVDGLCAVGARCGSDGRCVTPGGAGESCARGSDCAPPLDCVDTRCAAPDTVDVGLTCAGPAGCDGDTQCLASFRRACAPLATEGPCTGDADCAHGDYCDDARRCAAAPGDGEPCGGGVACAEGLGCGFGPGANEDVCGPLPGRGEPCALGRDGPFLCAAELACRDRFCGPIPGPGETCAVGDVRCADGLGCHFEGAESVCRPRHGEGGACQLDDACGAGLFCDFSENRCRAWYAAGEVCRAGNECGAEGACVPDESLTFRCVPQPGLGEACFLDTCAPGLACRSPFDAGVCARPLCTAYPF